MVCKYLKLRFCRTGALSCVVAILYDIIKMIFEILYELYVCFIGAFIKDADKICIFVKK